MANEECYKSNHEICDHVVEQLVMSGVQPERIVREKWVCRGDGERYAADIAVVNDFLGVDAVFEVKLRNGMDHNIVRQVLLDMKHVIGLCKCYLVTEEKGELIVARLTQNGLMPEWQKLSKLKFASENRGREVRDYERKMIGAIGLILVAMFVWGEVAGVEFSWKIYSLLLLVATLFAASSGYRFSFKAGPGGCALSVGGDVKEKGDAR